MQASFSRHHFPNIHMSYTEPLNNPNPAELRMLPVPAGTLKSPGCDDVEIPAFHMAETVITQAQWREVAQWEERPGEKWDRELDPNPSRFTGDDLPVDSVNWYDAKEFCNRLSQRTGNNYTLPTADQWEYACRAGTTTEYYTGDELTKEDANFDSNGTTPVFKYSPNPWGFRDMHGNVWEWCLNDWEAKS